jgi:hypothetical protein
MYEVEVPLLILPAAPSPGCVTMDCPFVFVLELDWIAGRLLGAHFIVS